MAVLNALTDLPHGLSYLASDVSICESFLVFAKINPVHLNQVQIFEAIFQFICANVCGELLQMYSEMSGDTHPLAHQALLPDVSSWTDITLSGEEM